MCGQNDVIVAKMTWAHHTKICNNKDNATIT